MQDTFYTKKPKMPKTDENQNLTNDDWWTASFTVLLHLLPIYLQSKIHKVENTWLQSVQRMSDEDDYMSDAFLKSLEDKRPGLIHGKKAQQLMKEEKIR